MTTDSGPTTGRHDRRLSTAVAILVVLAIAFREPSLWTHPRFYAEEGLFYFEVAWSRPFFDAVTTVPQGYFNLCCQVSSQLALLVPLEHAPLVTTAIALLIQCVPPLLLLRIGTRAGWNRRTTFVAVAIAVLGSSFETWLTSTMSPMHLVFAGALVILFAESVGLRHLGSVILAGAALSTPQAFALLPMAAWRALRCRSRDTTRNVLVLAAALALQGTTMAVCGIPTGRSFSFEADLGLAALATKCYVLPFGGNAGADWVGIHVLHAYYVGTFWRWVPVLLAPVLLFWWAIGRSRSAAAIGLVVTSHCLVAVAVVGSLGHKSLLVGGFSLVRYFWCANVLDAIAAIEVLRRGARGWSRFLLVAFVTCAAFHWSVQFASRDPSSVGADWRTEVAAWRAEPSRALEIRPEGWPLHLAPR